MKPYGLAILLFLCAALSVWASLRTVERDDDFAGIYGAAKLAGSGQLFDAERIRIAEAPYQKAPSVLIWLRLPIYAYIWKPLTLLPYPAARWIWTLLQAAALAAAVWLWPASSHWQKAFVLVSYPFAYNLTLGQDTGLVLLCAVAGCRMLEQGRDRLAGLLLSLCAIKFNLALLIPVVLIARRKWNSIWSAALGLAGLGALSCVEGTDWVAREVASIRSLPRVRGAVQMPNFRGLGWYFPQSALVEFACGLVVTILVWWIARRTSSIRVAIAAALAGGLLISHHAFLYDGVLLMPLLMLSIAQEGYRRMLAAILISPLPYLLYLVHSGYVWFEALSVIVGFTVVLIFLLSRRDDSGLLTLPLRLHTGSRLPTRHTSS